MRILRDPSEALQIINRDIQLTIEDRFHEVSGEGPYDADSQGYFLLIEPGDRPEGIAEEIGFSILANLFDGTPYGDPDFTPSFEWLERHEGEHGVFFEMLFVLNDDGFAVAIFIPEEEGIDPDLLALCAEYATPAE